MVRDSNRTCEDCFYRQEMRCLKWKTMIPKQSVAQECNAYRPVAETKDGRTLAQQQADRRRASRQGKARKLAESNRLKPGQEESVRFVQFEEDIIERIDGKYRPTFEVRIGRGLQIKNRIYLEDGTYKLVNRRSLRIKTVYTGVPHWANRFLREQYTAAAGRTPK